MGKSAQNRVGIDFVGKDSSASATADRVAEKVRQAGKEVERTDRKMGGVANAGQRRWGRGIFELSRGLEDFGQQLSVGLGQAVRASANNVTQFAATALGPLAGTLVSVSVGLGFMIPVLMKLADEMNGNSINAETFKKGLDELLARFQRVRALDQFNDSLDDMKLERFEELRAELRKTVQFTESEITQLQTKLRIALTAGERENGFDLAAVAGISRERLERSVKQEEKILHSMGSLDLEGTSLLFPGEAIPASEENRKKFDALREQLHKLRESVGVGDDTPLAGLLKDLEKLEEGAPAIGELGQEIVKRRREALLAQEKLNKMREREAEITKRQIALDRTKLGAANNAAVSPRTQQFVAGLARAQLDIVSQGKPVKDLDHQLNPEEKRLLQQNNNILADIQGINEEVRDALQETSLSLVSVTF